MQIIFTTVKRGVGGEGVVLPSSAAYAGGGFKSGQNSVLGLYVFALSLLKSPLSYLNEADQFDWFKLHRQFAICCKLDFKKLTN